MAPDIEHFLTSGITKALVGGEDAYFASKWRKLLRPADVRVSNASLRPSWNWPAFFFVSVYLFYRKMYLAGSVFLAALAALEIANEVGGVSMAVGLVLSAACGAFANSTYLNHTYNKYRKLMELHVDAVLPIADKEGGTSVAGALLALVLTLAIGVGVTLFFRSFNVSDF